MNDPGWPELAAGTSRPSVAEAVPASAHPEPAGAASCAAVQDASVVPEACAMLTATWYGATFAKPGTGRGRSALSPALRDAIAIREGPLQSSVKAKSFDHPVRSIAPASEVLAGAAPAVNPQRAVTEADTGIADETLAGDPPNVAVCDWALAETTQQP